VNVPLLDLRAQYAPIRASILEAITRVCDSQQFILGDEVAALEGDLASRLDVRHAVGVSSGTDALLVALMALDVRAGDEVIVPAFSFFATAGSVARVGATPVFVDIDPVTFAADPAAIAAALTPRTRAIVPVHLYGLAADLDPILATAQAAGVPVIEDAAQAIGAKYFERIVGGDGELGAFSFYPTKNLGAFGDAGLLTTNDPARAERIVRLRDHGADRRYIHREIGGNFRLDALQAAVLRVKAAHLEAWTAGRRSNAARYRALFAERALDEITLPVEPPDRFHIYNQFVIRAPRRDDLRAHLAAAGVGTAIYYPVPLHLQECFAPLGGRPGMLPQAEAASREVLALPIFPELTEDQQRHVVESIAEFYRPGQPAAGGSRQ
jgi:dTDP-4-amino-4,6-dideoxygalactose transaminase